MDVDMDAHPAYFDPQHLTSREDHRRFRERHSGSEMSPYRETSPSKFRESRLLYDGQDIHSPTNAVLLLENLKREVDDDYREGTPENTLSASKRRLSAESREISEADVPFDSVRGTLKVSDYEEESLVDGTDTTFALFASLLDSALQGLMSIPDLILRLEESCRNVSESIRYGSNIRHRVLEDKMMRQKAQLLLDEAASWSLLWYLYGKGNSYQPHNFLTGELPKDLIVFPPTSHLEACQFVSEDHTAQLCLRIVQWLEGLASKALDLENKVRGSHVGTYLPSSGVWHHTQRSLIKKASNINTIHHLDFDAPTRENAHQLPDDKKQDDSLIEDVWTLLRAGRIEEACDLCRSAGQPWRAATLCPFGGLDQFPSVEAFLRNGKKRTLQAIELESGIGHQWHLWKWASYCASEKIAELDGGKYEAAVYAFQCGNLKRMLPICTDWESACWAMAKSWLDVLVDLELARLQPGKMDKFKNFEDSIEGNPGNIENSFQNADGLESWPLQVLSQQPRQISALLQKLHSGEMVHETVSQACKEQQRQIEMILMLGDIPRLLDLIWSWIAPSEVGENFFRPHGDPQMIRFGAHLVLILRFLLGEEMKGAFKEKIMSVGDLILNMYAMFLFSKQHEELVGIYASQVARHLCIDLFVHMMELRLNSGLLGKLLKQKHELQNAWVLKLFNLLLQNARSTISIDVLSVYVKHKIFVSAMEYLPFSPEDDSKGSFEEIIERVLSRSRDIRNSEYDKLSDVAEHHRLQSLQKALVIQWLCFTPPSTITNVETVSTKLLLRALMHSNILFREFALISMWRVPAMPIGAHKLLSYLAEPLRQNSKILDDLSDDDVYDNLKEFEDWNEYYSCDARYRHWLKIELENGEVSELSVEEKQRAIAAANETLNSSFLLLLRKENPWLDSFEDYVYESVEPVFLELRAMTMLCLPSGECLRPDATICTTLMSALHASVSDEVLNRQLMVNVTISSKDSCCIEVVLRCLAVPGDGLPPLGCNGGGILGNILAAGFKGELHRFQAGVTMEVLRLDAWYSSKDGSVGRPATFIVQGLCRRCCLPELILRCLQVFVALMELGIVSEKHDELIELAGCSQYGFFHLFSQQQFQEFLILEREYTIRKMEHEELSS